MGGMFFLMERKDGSPILVVGPCWPFCTFVTLPLVIIVVVLVSYLIVFDGFGLGMPWWVGLIYFPLAAFTLVSLFMVGCRDPGLIERITDEEAGRNGWYWNEQTGSFRPVGAMYCRECKVGCFLVSSFDKVLAGKLLRSSEYSFSVIELPQVLIQGYDHLCPWTGTGIGEKNMCAFKMFVASINILCYFSVALVAVAGVMSLNRSPSG